MLALQIAGCPRLGSVTSRRMERFKRFRIFGSDGSSGERIFCAFQYSLRDGMVPVPVSVPDPDPPNLAFSEKKKKNKGNHQKSKGFFSSRNP